MTGEHITYTGTLGKVTERSDVWKRRREWYSGKGNSTCKTSSGIKGNLEDFVLLLEWEMYVRWGDDKRRHWRDMD